MLALSESHRSIADKLLSEELISEEAYSSIQPLSLLPKDIARKILNCVKTTICLNPGRYRDFVQLLQNDAGPRNTGIINSLEEAYSSILKDQKGCLKTVSQGGTKDY